MKNLVTLIVILFISSQLNAQVLIELKNGKDYEGFVTQSTNENLQIKSTNGIQYTFSRAEIKKVKTLNSTITLINGSIIEGYISKMDDKSIYITPQNALNTNDMTIDRKDVLNFEISDKNTINYPTFGATFGTPGGFNLNGGYTTGNFSFRATVGAIPTAAFGMQASGSYLLSNSKNFETGFGIGAGYLDIDGGDFAYIEPLYHLNFYGVFLELGLGIGKGSYTNPQVLFQLGYVHRFN